MINSRTAFLNLGSFCNLESSSHTSFFGFLVFAISNMNKGVIYKPYTKRKIKNAVKTKLLGKMPAFPGVSHNQILRTAKELNDLRDLKNNKLNYYLNFWIKKKRVPESGHEPNTNYSQVKMMVVRLIYKCFDIRRGWGGRIRSMRWTENPMTPKSCGFKISFRDVNPAPSVNLN